MNINQIAVPAMIVLGLSYLFQDIKPALEMVPGMRVGDVSHDDALRVVYGLLAFVAVLAWQLYTAGAPADWFALLVQVGATAVSMSVTGHYLYQKIGSGSQAPLAPSQAQAAGVVASDAHTPDDYPPGVSFEDMGLPTA